MPDARPLSLRVCDTAVALSLAGLCCSTALYNAGLVVGLGAFAVAARAKRGPGVDTLDGLGLALLAYVAAVALTAPLGVRPVHSLAQLTRSSVLVLGWLVANRAADRRARMVFLGALAAASLYAALFGLWEWRHPGRWKHEALSPGKIAGPASDTIDFSARLTPLLSAALGLVMYSGEEPRLRPLAALWCLPVGAALVVTQTRSNLLAVAAALAAGALFSGRRAPLLAMAALVGGALLVRAPMLTRYRTITDSADPSNRYRIDVLRIAAGIARDYAPWGVGRGNFGVVHDRRKTPATESKLSAHNNYVDLLCECGIPGLGAFLWIHIAFLTRLWRGLRDGPLLPERSARRAVALGAVQGFVAFMTFGLFHSNWSYLLPPGIAMAMVGLGWGACAAAEAPG